MALIFFGSILVPSTPTIIPRQVSSVLKNSHLDGLAQSQFFLNTSNTSRMCFLCSFLVLLQIRMSSRQTQQNRSIYGRKILFINLCQVVGALVNLKGITSNSNRPNFVRKVVRYSSPFLIRILLNVVTISIFEKYFIPFSAFRVSLVSGSGYRSFLEIAFSPRQSMHRRRLPLDFFINRIGDEVEEELSRIKPLRRFSSIYSFNVCSQTQDIGYRGPQGSV